MEKKDSTFKNTQASSGADTQRYLVFSLAQEEYAVPLLAVKEVIGMTETTPIPFAPSYFKGVINLRGQVISVVDLRVKLNLTKPPKVNESSIIILDLAPLCLGVIVDSIDSVIPLSSKDLSPAPDVETSINKSCLTCIARKDKRLILVLDMKATLNVQDMAVLEPHQKQAA